MKRNEDFFRENNSRKSSAAADQEMTKPFRQKGNDTKWEANDGAKYMWYFAFLPPSFPSSLSLSLSPLYHSICHSLMWDLSSRPGFEPGHSGESATSQPLHHQGTPYIFWLIFKCLLKSNTEKAERSSLVGPLCKNPQMQLWNNI